MKPETEVSDRRPETRTGRICAKPYYNGGQRLDTPTILSIEDEARAAALRDVATLVADVERHRCEPCEPDPEGWMVDREQVLAAIDALRAIA